MKKTNKLYYKFQCFQELRCRKRCILVSGKTRSDARRRFEIRSKASHAFYWSKCQDKGRRAVRIWRTSRKGIVRNDAMFTAMFTVPHPSQTSGTKTWRLFFWIFFSIFPDRLHITNAHVALIQNGTESKSGHCELIIWRQQCFNPQKCVLKQAILPWDKTFFNWLFLLQIIQTPGLWETDQRGFSLVRNSPNQGESYSCAGYSCSIWANDNAGFETEWLTLTPKVIICRLNYYLFIEYVMIWLWSLLRLTWRIIGNILNLLIENSEVLRG